MTMTNRPRVTTVVIAFLLVSAAASPLLAVAQGATGLDPTILVLTQFATAVGALVLFASWRRRLPFPTSTRRGILAPVAVAVGLSLAVGLVLWLLALTEPHRWHLLDTSTLPAPLALILLAQFVGAAGEEIGWRGAVQPALETRMSTLSAAVLTGALFGVGHFYVVGAGVAVYAVFIVSAIGMSIAAAALTVGRPLWTRVFVATVLHWGINIVMLLGFADGDESMLSVAHSAVALTVAGVVVLPFLVATGSGTGIGAGPDRAERRTARAGAQTLSRSR